MIQSGGSSLGGFGQLIVSHQWPSEMTIAGLQAWIENRGQIADAHDNIADLLNTAKTGPLAVQQGKTADSISELFDEGEQLARETAMKNGVKKDSYTAALGSVHNLRSKLSDIADRYNQEINKIILSNEPAAVKMPHILEAIGRGQQEANLAAANCGGDIGDAGQRILDQEGSQQSFRQFAKSNGIDMGQLFRARDTKGLESDVQGMLDSQGGAGGGLPAGVSHAASAGSAGGSSGLPAGVSPAVSGGSGGGAPAAVSPAVSGGSGGAASGGVSSAVSGGPVGGTAGAPAGVSPAASGPTTRATGYSTTIPGNTPPLAPPPGAPAPAPQAPAGPAPLMSPGSAAGQAPQAPAGPAPLMSPGSAAGQAPQAPAGPAPLMSSGSAAGQAPQAPASSASAPAPRPSADVQPGVLRLWRRTARPIRHAVQRRRIPGRPAAQLRRGRVHAPRRRRVWGLPEQAGSRQQRRSRRQVAPTPVSPQTAPTAGSGDWHSSIPARATICAAGAVLQFSGRAADDELAIVDNSGFTPSAPSAPSGALPAMAPTYGPRLASVPAGSPSLPPPPASSSPAPGSPTTNPAAGSSGVANTAAARPVPVSAAPQPAPVGIAGKAVAASCGRGCGGRDFGRRDSTKPVAAHR